MPQIKDAKDDAPSTIAASTTCPRPLLRASMTAASTPKANSMPPPAKSPKTFSGTTGPLVRVPIASSTPVSAM